MTPPVRPNYSRFRLALVTPVHWRAYMGGSQYQVKCLLDHLVPSGRFEIHYLARRVTSCGPVDGYQIHCIGRPGPKPRLGLAMDTRRLLARLHRLRPDAIYQRVGCPYTGVTAAYARWARIPMLWHVASDADVTPGLKSAGRNPLRSVLDRHFLSFGIRNADMIVTQTKQQSDLLRANFGRTATAIVPNFHPDPGPTPAIKVGTQIVWIANFKPLKQPDAFVRLAATLRDLSDVRFVMIGSAAEGSGDEGWHSALQREIAASPNVEYLGPRSQQEVNATLNNAYLFVNTSRFEGFPNTFIQAWLRRVPVLSLNVNPDGIFDREEVGIHVRTEQQLSEITRALIADPARRARMAEAAERHARTHHSMANATRIESLLLERVMVSGR